MPVVDGEFVPNAPLVLAERQVDYLRLNRHILAQRTLLEQRAAPAARQAALQIVELGYPSPRLADRLAATLERQLGASARFGAREAPREIRRLRAARPALAYSVPDAGRFGQLARAGLDGVLALVTVRATAAAQAVLTAAAAGAQNEPDPVLRAAAATVAAGRALHNQVLELVGEVVNMGRAAGALGMREPPEFAMRSEQLDKRTCQPCDTLHGEIVIVDSPEFYELMPPNGCLGGGRCRGVYVFGDGPADVRAGEPTEEELAELRRRARPPQRRAA